MSEQITLSGRTFTAARLRRIGGELNYFDDLIPVGTEVAFVDARHDVANLVLNEGDLVPVYMCEITDETFAFVCEIPETEAYDTINEAFRFQVIVGNKFDVRAGTVLRRTGRPIMSWNQVDVPFDRNLTVDSNDQVRVWYDAPGMPRSFFHSCYLTDAYFAVI